MRTLRIVLIITVLVLAGAALMLYLSAGNLKDKATAVALDALRHAIGHEATVGQVDISLLPPGAVVTDIKILGKDGQAIAQVGRLQVALGLLELLDRRVLIKNISVDSPVINLTREQAQGIAKSLEQASPKSNEEGAFKIDLRRIKVNGGALSYKDEAGELSLDAQGLDAEVELDNGGATYSVEAQRVGVSMSGLNLGAGIKSQGAYEDGLLTVSALELSTGKSTISASATLKDAYDAAINLNASLFVDTVKQALKLKGPGQGNVKINGTVKLGKDTLTDPALDLALKGDFYLETLMESLGVEDLQYLKGLITFDGAVKGPVSDMHGSARASIKKAYFYGVDVDALKCDVTYSKDKLTFSNGEGRLYGGSAKARVELSMPYVATYSVRVEAAEITAMPIFKLIGLSDLVALPNGTLTGTFNTSGAEFAPNGEFHFRTALATGSGEDLIARVQTAKGSYSLIGDVLELTGIEAATAQSSASVSGQVHFKDETLDFAGKALTADVRDLNEPYFKDLSGGAEGKFRIHGKWADPSANADVTLWDATLYGYGLGRVELGADYHEGRIALERADAKGPGGALSVAGSIAFPQGKDGQRHFDDPLLDLKARATGVGINNLLSALGTSIDIDGKLDAEAAISQRATNPTIKASAQGSGIKAFGINVPKASADVFMQDERIDIKTASMELPSSSITGEGFVTLGGQYQFKASAAKLSLGDLFSPEAGVEGEASVRASGKGTFEAPEALVDISLKKLALHGKALDGGRLQAVLKGKEYTLNAALVNNLVLVKGSGRIERDMPWSANVEFTSGRYETLLRPFLKTQPADLMVTMAGNAALTGSTGHLESKLELTRLMVHMFGQSFTNNGTIVCKTDGGKLDIASMSLQGADTAIAVSGSMDIGKSYDLQLGGSTALSLFGGMMTQIESPRGVAELAMSIGGQWDDPRLDGSMAVRQASFGIKGFQQRFTDMDAYAYFDGSKVVLEYFKARLGGGAVDISGNASIESWKLARYYLEGKFDDITVYISKDSKARIGGEFTAKGSSAGSDVAGELRIYEAQYNERVDWKSWLLKTRRPTFRVESPWATKTSLNLRIVGNEGITVENNIVRAPLGIDLVVRGTLAAPRLFGRVETSEGKLYFRNSEFRIESATADYSDVAPAEPYLRVNAETQVRGYLVRLSLSGTVDQLDMSVSSDPPLDEMAILGLLTVGEFGSSLAGIEGGIGAAEATSFLTGQVQDFFEEEFQNITGLDRFQIDPYVSKGSSSVTPRVTVSKKIIGTELYVTYSTVISDKGESEVRMEYLLSKDVSLVGAKDERGNIGADVKIKLRFK